MRRRQTCAERVRERDHDDGSRKISVTSFLSQQQQQRGYDMVMVMVILAFAGRYAPHD